jgi:hypothetical protein
MADFADANPPYGLRAGAVILAKLQYVKREGLDVKLNRACKIQAIAAILFFLSTCFASAAETAWDVIKHFGLSGVWSINCSQRAASKSFHTIFSKGPDGLAVREIDYGAGFPIRLPL